MKVYVYRVPQGSKQKKSFPKEMQRLRPGRKFSPYGGMIVAIERSGEQEISIGVSTCSMADVFNFDLGLKIAKDRLYMAMASVVTGANHADTSDKILIKIGCPASVLQDKWISNTVAHIFNTAKTEAEK
jgi:hypothetical protein